MNNSSYIKKENDTGEENIILKKRWRDKLQNCNPSTESESIIRKT